MDIYSANAAFADAKYEQADKELAELLGWHRLQVSLDVYGKPSRLRGDNHSLHLVNDYIPRWTLDDGECFRLMVAHCVSVTVYDDGTTADCFTHKRLYISNEDHTGAVTATRYAIVQAVISKLKGNV